MAPQARADILSFNASAHSGVSVGQGLVGERQDDAFHQQATGPMYGVDVGVEVMFVDVWISHDQFLDGGVSGTWTQFMLGLDLEVDVGDNKGVDYNDAGDETGGYQAWTVELGMGFGYAVGTGQQVDPPLDNSQLTDKGLVLEGRVGIAYNLTQLLNIGVVLPVQSGLVTKTGEGAVVNNIDNTYAYFAGALLLRLGATLEIL